MNKTRKMNWKRTFENNRYMIKLIANICPGILAFSFSATVLQAISTFVSTTFLYQYALNTLQEGQDLKKILLTLLCLISYSLFNSLFQQISNCYINLKYPKVEAHIQNLLQKKAAEVDLVCFENTEFFDTYVKAVNEASDRAYAVLQNILNFIWAVVYTVGVITVIFVIDPLFILLALLPLVCTMLVGKKRNRTKYEYNVKFSEVARQRDYVKRTFYFNEFSKEMRLTAMWTVMLNRMKASVVEMKSLVSKYGYKMMFYKYLLDFMFDIVVETGSIILATYKTLVLKNMLIGDCFVVINSIVNLANKFNYMGDVVFKLDEHSLYIDNLRDFLEYKIRISENESAPPVDKFKTLELCDVSFRYNNQDAYVLKKVNMTIHQGEKIAIVGHNGAGKTTLIKLFQRLYDPSCGEILLNGENIKNYRLSSYRNLFGTVFQNYQLFATTVAENVMLHGNIGEKEKQIVKSALANAGIYHKIALLPHGIDSNVTKEFDDSGVVFSGGEAQKIAIARIFASHDEIVIMDEPTSALDPIAEQEMYRNMFKACIDKTVIFISHRLSSAAIADRIYMFEKGEIIEQGTHDELLSLGLKYANMWHKQADVYMDAKEVMQ